MKFEEFVEKYLGLKPRLADKYGGWLGYQIQDVDTKNFKTSTILSIREDHLSPSGAVHGGVISGFLDFSCGCAVIASLSTGELCSTVDLNVKYFKPLTNGDKIVAKAEVVHRGRTLCTVIAKLFCEGKEAPVALATGTFNIYIPKQD